MNAQYDLFDNELDDDKGIATLDDCKLALSKIMRCHKYLVKDRLKAIEVLVKLNGGEHPANEGCVTGNIIVNIVGRKPDAIHDD